MRKLGFGKLKKIAHAMLGKENRVETKMLEIHVHEYGVNRNLSEILICTELIAL